MRAPIPPRRRASPALVGSLVLHAVLAVVLARAVMTPGSMSWLLPRDRADRPKDERIAYVAVAPARPLPPSQLGRSGGDGRPARAGAARSAAPIVAPARVPVGVTAAPTARAGTAAEAGGTGPLVGGGGPLRGIQPRYGDPRVWVPPGEVAAAPKTSKERLDSAIAVRLKQHQDSVAVAAGVRRPGDWTVARDDGSKFGVEPGANGGMPKLWLGRISIPLPLGLPVRPGQLERERALRTITADLAQQAPRRLTEDEFRKAVREIRDRKEWERTRQQAAERKGGAPKSAPKADQGARD